MDILTNRIPILTTDPGVRYQRMALGTFHATTILHPPKVNSLSQDSSDGPYRYSRRFLRHNVFINRFQGTLRFKRDSPSQKNRCAEHAKSAIRAILHMAQTAQTGTKYNITLLPPDTGLPDAPNCIIPLGVGTWGQKLATMVKWE